MNSNEVANDFACTDACRGRNGAMEKEPSEDSVEVAEMLLEEGSQIPADCVFQAEFPQGSGVYESFDTVYGTTYICYR